jgi:hypothetical protein
MVSIADVSIYFEVPLAPEMEALGTSLVFCLGLFGRLEETKTDGSSFAVGCGDVLRRRRQRKATKKAKIQPPANAPTTAPASAPELILLLEECCCEDDMLDVPLFATLVVLAELDGMAEVDMLVDDVKEAAPATPSLVVATVVVATVLDSVGEALEALEDE